MIARIALSTLVLSLATPLGLASIQYSKEEATKVLKAAEEIRSLDRAELKVTLATKSEDYQTVYELEILRTTGNRALVNFVAPTEEVGRRMLANNKRYWSTFPDSKRVVAVSRREVLGNSAFAFADIFSLDAEKDYDPTIVGETKIGGVDCLELHLASRHEETPYGKIIYYVEKDGYFPQEAKFFGISGKHLKTMKVVKRKSLGGRVRPSMVKMVDETAKGKVSVWRTNSMRPKKVPDQVFTKNYLKSLL